MKSKLLRRTAAFVLALTMALSTAMYASAGTDSTPDITTPSSGYNLAIQDDEGSSTGKYVAYQIFKGKVVEGKEDTLTSIDWGTGINKAGLLTALSSHTSDFESKITDWDTTGEHLFKGTESATQIAAILEKYSTNTEFVKLFAKYAGENLTTSGTDLTWNAGDKTYKGSVSDAGYYLIADKSTTTGESHYVFSSHILKVVQDVTEKAKHSMPKITKEITGEDGVDIVPKTTAAVAGIGDTVSYSLTGTLPDNYADFEHFYYKFTDKLPKGLTLKETTIKIKFGDSTETAVTNVADGNNFYYTVASDATTGETTLTVIVKDLKKVVGLTKASEIIVTYDCTVNSSAGIYADEKKDNKNTADITFTNSPYTDYNGEGEPGDTTTTTTTDEADVFVLRLNIHKLDDAGNPLSGAKFKIKNKDNKYAKATGSNGVYTVTEWVENETDATEFDTSTSGELVINGLDDEEYTISETTTPDGYTGIEDFDITLKATASEDTKEKGKFELTVENPEVDPVDSHVTASVDKETEGGKTTGSVTVGVINDKDSNLPSTGGSGVYFYYAVGGGLVVVASAALVLTRKKKKS